MQQTFFCPNCNSPVEYGERFCGYCGFTITWQPPYQQQGLGQQTPWGQPQWNQDQNPYNQPPQWGQQSQWGQSQGSQNQYPYNPPPPGYGQPPQYNPPPQWANQNPYNQSYSGYYGGTKKKSPAWPIYLTIFVILLFAAGGIILATKGSVFDIFTGGDSSRQSSSTSSPAAQTPKTPEIKYDAEPKIEEFFVDPSSIKPGGTASLNWLVSNASSVTIDNGIGNQPAAGIIPVNPSKDTTYRITASNNKGVVAATTSVTVSSADAPQINSFTANPASLNVGQSTTLQWNISGATSIIIDQDIGDVTSLGGSKSISPLTTTTYTITATNATGTNMASVTVTISISPDAPVITLFTATPTTITAGQPATLEWYVTGATSITMTPDIGTMSSYGTKGVTPGTTTTYILTASNDSGTVTASLAVNVQGSTAVNAPIINSFTANPTEMTSLQTVTLTWDTTSADTVSISDIGDVPVSGSSTAMPTTTTTYTLTATNSYGSVTASITVTLDISN